MSFLLTKTRSAIDSIILPLDPAKIRLTIARMLCRAQAAHFGCCMSAVEILAAIYSTVDLDPIRRRDQDRDRVIVSKGHCAAAVYATLHHAGLLPAEALETYCQPGSKLIGLVGHGVPGVEHSTGSLGHGLSVACGTALAYRAKGSSRSVYVVCGDGELQEGSCWEGIMLAAHLKLSNLYLLVDDNQLGMIRRTDEVCDVDPARRLAAFGWKVWHLDGHNLGSIQAALAQPHPTLRPAHQGPTALICRTVKGKGYPPAEGDPRWHYRTPGDADLAEMERLWNA